MKLKRDEAKRLIASQAFPVGREIIRLDEGYMRVLAEDIFSPLELPEQNKSAIDGFAFNTASLKELPARLKVVAQVNAGENPDFKLSTGEAAAVMTGAPIPQGANAAVRVEDVKVEGDSVVIDFPVKEGSLVNFKGSEISRGELLVSKGEVLDFRKVALLANVGIYKLSVFQRVKVGIIITGDEVLEPYEPHKSGAVRNTNFYILKGLLSDIGAIPVYFGTVKDEPKTLKEAIEESLSTCDITITTGGVSKGKRDYVKEVVKEIGVEVLFTQTNVRPGRPCVFGTRDGKLFFGLPGYPAAMLVNAVEYLLPAVRKMMGVRRYENAYLTAIAKEELHSREGRVDFIRVKVESSDGCLYVSASPLSQQTSNFFSMAKCDALAIADESVGKVREGSRVEIFTFFLHNFLNSN